MSLRWKNGRVTPDRSLSTVSAPKLGSHAIKGQFPRYILHRSVLIYHTAAVERAGIKSEDVEEVFFGNVLSAK